jgi:hypothetical protein
MRAQLVNHSLPFMQPEYPSPYLHEPAKGLCPESHESNPPSHYVLFKIHFNCIKANNTLLLISSFTPNLLLILDLGTRWGKW